MTNFCRTRSISFGRIELWYEGAQRGSEVQQCQESERFDLQEYAHAERALSVAWRDEPARSKWKYERLEAWGVFGSNSCGGSTAQGSSENLKRPLNDAICGRLSAHAIYPSEFDKTTMVGRAMGQQGIGGVSIAEKAKSERLYLHYALALSVSCILLGCLLTILGAGEHLDIVVTARGAFETRLINATPGVGLMLLGGTVFFLSKPRRLKYNSKHQRSEEPEAQVAQPVEQIDSQVLLRAMVGHFSSATMSRKQGLDEITELFLKRINLLEDRLQALTGGSITDGIETLVVASPIFNSSGRRLDGQLSPSERTKSISIKPGTEGKTPTLTGLENSETTKVPSSQSNRTTTLFEEDVLYQTQPPRREGD